MNDVRHEELMRLSLKRELTPEEESRLEAWLATNPKARAAWDEDRALGRALHSLPDVPVSSNFTARVLQAVELDERHEQRAAKRFWLQVPWPRVSWGLAAGLLACAGIFYEYRIVQGGHFADAVQKVSSDLAALPTPDALEDFDAINHMRQSAAGSVAVMADADLLKAFQ
jgi:anti-sigma factor RsiW